MSGEIGHDVTDPERLDSLRSAGLDAAPVAEFDRFAGLVRSVLEVPVALVSFVDDVRQYFPGAAGLDAPWSETRQLPLSHAFCLLVVAHGAPLVVADARTDVRLAENPAVEDLGVVAYAGVPLTDDAGRVLGALCAIDHRPRQWTDREIALLRDLAAACGSEIRLRIAAHASELADVERERIAGRLTDALHNSRLLLDGSETMSTATSLTEVVEAVGKLTSAGSAPAFAGIGFVDTSAPTLTLVMAPSRSADLSASWNRIGRRGMYPPARSLRDRRSLFYADRPELLADFPELEPELDRLGWQSLVCVPLLGAADAFGVMMFAWSEPHLLDWSERATITALAGYVTHAVGRLIHLRERAHVAEVLQRAMLTDLPSVPGLDLAADYRPVHDGEQVGGDWYDAFVLPGGDIMLVIGDVAGHDMVAATVMGQFRSMLRGIAVDRSPSPGELLDRMDTAASVLDISTTVTMVVARLARIADGYEVTWSNAGHPPPMVHRRGAVEILTPHDPIIGMGITGRHDHTLRLGPGDTLMFYTDGLVEIRDVPVLSRIDTLAGTLSARAALAPTALLDRVIEDMSGDGMVDDVAALICRAGRSGAPAG